MESCALLRYLTLSLVFCYVLIEVKGAALNNSDDNTNITSQSEKPLNDRTRNALMSSLPILRLFNDNKGFKVKFREPDTETTPTIHIINNMKTRPEGDNIRGTKTFRRFSNEFDSILSAPLNSNVSFGDRIKSRRIYPKFEESKNSSEDYLNKQYQGIQKPKEENVSKSHVSLGQRTSFDFGTSNDNGSLLTNIENKYSHTTGHDSVESQGLEKSKNKYDLKKPPTLNATKIYDDKHYGYTTFNNSSTLGPKEYILTDQSSSNSNFGESIFYNKSFDDILPKSETKDDVSELQREINALDIYSRISEIENILNVSSTQDFNGINVETLSTDSNHKENLQPISNDYKPILPSTFTYPTKVTNSQFTSNFASSTPRSNNRGSYKHYQKSSMQAYDDGDDLLSQNYPKETIEKLRLEKKVFINSKDEASDKTVANQNTASTTKPNTDKFTTIRIRVQSAGTTKDPKQLITNQYHNENGVSNDGRNPRERYHAPTDSKVTTITKYDNTDRKNDNVERFNLSKNVQKTSNNPVNESKTWNDTNKMLKGEDDTSDVSLSNALSTNVKKDNVDGNPHNETHPDNKITTGRRNENAYIQKWTNTQNSNETSNVTVKDKNYNNQVYPDNSDKIKLEQLIQNALENESKFLSYEDTRIKTTKNITKDIPNIYGNKYNNDEEKKSPALIKSGKDDIEYSIHRFENRRGIIKEKEFTNPKNYDESTTYNTPLYHSDKSFSSEISKKNEKERNSLPKTQAIDVSLDSGVKRKLGVNLDEALMNDSKNNDFVLETDESSYYGNDNKNKQTYNTNNNSSHKGKVNESTTTISLIGRYDKKNNYDYHTKDQVEPTSTLEERGSRKFSPTRFETISQYTTDSMTNKLYGNSGFEIKSRTSDSQTSDDSDLSEKEKSYNSLSSKSYRGSIKYKYEPINYDWYDDDSAESTQNHPAQFEYTYKAPNDTNVYQKGFLKNINKRKVFVVHGSYKYTAPDGTPIFVSYTADENGFHPQEMKYDGTKTKSTVHEDSNLSEVKEADDVMASATESFQSTEVKDDSPLALDVDNEFYKEN